MPTTPDLSSIQRLLEPLGYVLAPEQPYISGERFLMSPHKLVLAGTTKEGEKVIIKASNTSSGVAEIESEKRARELLVTLAFANDTLLIAPLVYTGVAGGYTFFITKFIEQDAPFVARPLEEQFFIALRALEVQEAFHATTHEHVRQVKGVFEVASVDDYLHAFSRFVAAAQTHGSALVTLLKEGETFLQQNRAVIERYMNYLTHTDFVPHNMRLEGRKIYLLDHTAMRFANKYEGWARFINYMVLHSPALAPLLGEYVRKNRGEDEYMALRTMRVYKIGLLLNYYVQSLPKTEGDLHALIETRIEVWSQILKSVLEDTPLPSTVVEEYKRKRLELLSPEERARQKEYGTI